MTAAPGNPPGPTTGDRRVAAFDFDGTLTSRDCVVPFLRRVAGTVGLSTRLARHPGPLCRGLVTRDRDLLKSLAVQAAFSNRAEADVEKTAKAYAREIIADRLRSDTLAVLRAHQDAGDTVLLVSASFEIYLRPVGSAIGVDGVLAARLRTDERGVFTGELDGPNCRGREKVRRLHRWLDENAGGRAAVEVVAYGDSAGDDELLADADTAHWVGAHRP